MNTRTPRIDGIDPNHDWYREGKKNRELAIFCEVLSREVVSILKEPARGGCAGAGEEFGERRTNDPQSQTTPPPPCFFPSAR
jgi:hypothetical protein